MVQCGKKSAAACCGVGSLIFVISIIAGTLIANTFKTAMLSLMVYKYDDKFLDPAYEDCEATVTSYSFWNMSNYNDVVLHAAKPIYVEKGPYTFSRNKCKFMATVEENYETSYTYSPYGEFQDKGDGLSEHDVIYNFNFIYLSIMKMMEANGGSPEKTFAYNFVGYFLGQVIGGMQSADFINNVEAGAFAQMILPSVKSSLVSGLKNNALALNAISYVAANSSGNTLAFFNSATSPGGFANFMGTNQVLSAASINLILNGNGGSEPLGWLVDMNGGMGLLGFTMTSNNSAYSVTPQQLTDLKNYTNYLINNVGNTPTINTDANNVVYKQWSAGNVIPMAVTLPAGFPAFELSPPMTLSTAILTQLWNTSNSYSFTNPTSTVMWMMANTSSDITNLLSSTFGITAAQTKQIGNWVTGMVKSQENTILGALGATTTSDLAYIQFGQGTVLGGKSLSEVSPTVTGIPEIAIFSNYTLTLNLTSAKHVLALSMNSTTFTQFLGMLQMGMFTEIQGVWGLNSTQAITLASYFDQVVTDMVEPYLVHSVYAHGSGLITARSVREWLYNGSDPVMALLGLNPKAGLQVQSGYTTRAQALAAPPKVNEIFLGGGKEKLRQYFLKKTYKGNDTFYGWAEPIKVEGNRDPIFMPGVQHDADQVYWSDDVSRPIHFQDQHETITVKKIKLWKFRASPAYYGGAASFPENEKFYQDTEGVLNLTAIQPVRTFITRPHFRGVPTSFYSSLSSQSTFMPEEEKFDAMDIYLEPNAGIPFKAETLLQYNFGYKGVGRYANLSSPDGMYPFMWSNLTIVVDDDMANTFLKGKGLVGSMSVACYVLGPIVFVLCVVIAVVIYMKAQRRGKLTYVRSLE